jgi:hypothetical protein
MDSVRDEKVLRWVGEREGKSYAGERKNWLLLALLFLEAVVDEEDCVVHGYEGAVRRLGDEGLEELGVDAEEVFSKSASLHASEQ